MLPSAVAAVVDAVISADMAYPVFSPYSQYPQYSTIDRRANSVSPDNLGSPRVVSSVDPYYKMALSRLRKDKGQSHEAPIVVRPHLKKDLGLSPITVTRKQLNKKYNYADLEQLSWSESAGYQ